MEVEDILPDTLTFTGFTASVGAYDDATGVWAVGDLPYVAGDGTGTQTLTITATVNDGTTTAGRTITNTATVSSPMNEPTSGHPAQQRFGRYRGPRRRSGRDQDHHRR